MLWFDKHRRTRDDLSAHIDGRLSAARVRSLEQHLTACESCRGALAGLRATIAALHDLPQTESPGSFTLTPEQVAAERPTARASPALNTGVRIAAAGLACALALVFVLDRGGIIVDSGTNPPAQPAATAAKAAPAPADQAAAPAGATTRVASAPTANAPGAADSQVAGTALTSPSGAGNGEPATGAGSGAAPSTPVPGAAAPGLAPPTGATVAPAIGTPPVPTPLESVPTVAPEVAQNANASAAAQDNGAAAANGNGGVSNVKLLEAILAGLLGAALGGAAVLTLVQRRS